MWYLYLLLHFSGPHCCCSAASLLNLEWWWRNWNSWKSSSFSTPFTSMVTLIWTSRLFLEWEFSGGVALKFKTEDYLDNHGIIPLRALISMRRGSCKLNNTLLMATSDGPKDSNWQRNCTHPYKGEKFQICTTWVNRTPTKSLQDKEAFTVVERLWEWTSFSLEKYTDHN